MNTGGEEIYKNAIIAEVIPAHNKDERGKQKIETAEEIIKVITDENERFETPEPQPESIEEKASLEADKAITPILFPEEGKRTHSSAQTITGGFKTPPFEMPTTVSPPEKPEIQDTVPNSNTIGSHRSGIINAFHPYSTSSSNITETKKPSYWLTDTMDQHKGPPINKPSITSRVLANQLDRSVPLQRTGMLTPPHTNSHGSSQAHSTVTSLITTPIATPIAMMPQSRAQSPQFVDEQLTKVIPADQSIARPNHGDNAVPNPDVPELSKKASRKRKKPSMPTHIHFEVISYNSIKGARSLRSLGRGEWAAGCPAHNSQFRP